ncbi:MAG TPA: PhnD/SsuA/transferrin family substrate-binding protein [Pseudorhodoplanes sp.]|nr:PhnD/SsuA/transferrin family substrate-binding protein [Pseudorhodoplanes sp.]
MLKRLIGVAAVAAIMVTAPASAQQAIRLAVTDVEGMESLQRDFGPFKDVLERATGLKVDFFAVPGRTAAVEAMVAKQLDLVLTGPAEYVVFRARTNAQPLVALTRPDYFSQIVVLAEGPIKTAADLKGKKVSFGEIGSTSQHLGPAQVLADVGLTYGRDYDPIFIKRNVAVEALKRGDIAAVGMNLSHLQVIRRANPGVALRVIARGRDLPDDLILASADLSPDIVQKARDAFLQKSDDLMKAVVSQKGDNEKYIGGGFLPRISDRDYDLVRAMYRAVGINEFTKFIGN